MTGDVCNLSYSEKPFNSRIVLSLMDRLELSVSSVEGYHLFTDRHSSVQLAQELDGQKMSQNRHYYCWKSRQSKTSDDMGHEETEE
jgi:hypothetical protein